MHKHKHIAQTQTQTHRTHRAITRADTNTLTHLPSPPRSALAPPARQRPRARDRWTAKAASWSRAGC
eukprot:3077023-Rhodomonas_salina.1